MPTTSAAAPKPYKGVNMEGPIAAWYEKVTAGAAPEFAALARRLADEAGQGARVLEIAPGPGFLAIELAGLGCTVSAVDISRSFVRMTADKAARAGLTVDVRLGDAAALPFADGGFEAVVCRAAFKNFGDPVGALGEMWRVLAPGGFALIIDMRGDATDAAIASDVRAMGLGPLSAVAVRSTLKSLRRRAYLKSDFERMISRTPFGAGDIRADPLGLEVRLTRAPA